MAVQAEDMAGLSAGGWTGAAAARPGLADRLFEIERGRFALWVPVFFAAGIGAYFSLAHEPPFVLAAGLLVIALAARVMARGAALGLLLSGALACAALGFFAAKLRTDLVAAPVLSAQKDYALITGWVEHWEAREGQRNRLTIRVGAIDGLTLDATPGKVRITTHAETAPPVGSWVEVAAGLLPPPEPTHPGGFDFARMAYFMGLGAVGYALSDIKPRDGPPAPVVLRFWAAVDGLRATIRERVEGVLSGPAAGIATALISGDRGGIAEAEREAMRASGLAHVLAISGLHMAIMAGSIYWAMRLVLVAVPGLALRFSVKKWAALAALAGALGYLLISGASVATQRAFIMTAVFLIAVILDRPALTLRNVLIAAMVILALTPESLLNISFQMSFAAATALIAVYERLRGVRPIGQRGKSIASRAARALVRYAGGIGLTTMVAGLAVAPIAAFHFHTATSYSLIGNMLAMPVVGLVVMPAALAALLAMPFGLESGPLWVMGAGIDLVVAVAREVSALPGAVRPVEAFPVSALAAIALGALWFAIWRGAWRHAGLAAIGTGLVMTSFGAKPDIFIDRDGRVVAVRMQDGQLAAMPGRAGNYSLGKWLAADGDKRAPRAVRSDRVFRCDQRGCIADVRGMRLSVAREASALAQDCRHADIVVSPLRMRGGCTGPRIVITQGQLRRHGAHALFIRGEGEARNLRVETAQDVRGARPWSRVN